MLFRYNDVDYNADDELSFRDFTGQEFLSRPSIVFAGKVIRGSCFSQEAPDTVIFRGLLAGTIFVLCNLSNVVLPAGAISIDCQRTRFRVQNDAEDWLLNQDNTPMEPIRKADYVRLGVSIDPSNIPLVRLTKSILSTRD